MRFTKKNITNIIFITIILLLLYPPTKVYFIRLISFSPAIIKTEKSVKLKHYNWNLKGLNTSDINFNSTKNNVVFISFWATWCPPCIAEMPSIQKLYNDYKNQVTFILVTNENWNTVDKYYTKNQYNLPTYTNSSNPPHELKATSIPATYIINKQGNIVTAKKGAANWNSTKVRALLDQLIK
ncbi:TlpA family protein disulfide reductase [Tenacibaculum aestuariivivum]|uniref:TlpA family protein disulfide reductase n=1 Tax=Tenacibaculum aestuariivivum TaxID=2006131 RepID=UPI003AB515F4